MKKSNLRATAAWQALALLGAGSVVLTATPAFAQATTEPGAQVDPNAVPTESTESTSADPAQTENPAPGQPVAGVTTDTEADDAIVVTGTILRATAKATPSPVQVLDMDESEKRGVNTVNDAIQSISANGAGTLPNSFTANGAFAAGAAAASLRGLLTSNTLVLFDGLRAAYYPLADDGTRNFVDLNTIPDAIVDRVEVLKDGASSTYGADAVAGVVNIITKRQISGLHINASGGVSKYGDAGERKLDVTYGYGDLDEQGFNAYISGSIYKVGGIEQRDRKFPYNTGDLCNDGPHGGFGSGFGFGEECSYNIVVPPIFMVRPSGPNDNVGGSNQANPNRSDFQYANPAAGCRGLGTATISDADRARILDEQGINLYAYPDTFCTDDWVQNYFDITAPLERQSLSGRVTGNLSDSIEAYAMVNWVRSNTHYEGLPARFRRATPPALGPTFNSTNLSLPVWICPNGSATALPGNVAVQYTGCTNPDGTPLPGSVLNPNNPFAAQGSFARVVGFTPGILESDDITTKGLRGAAGISGEFGDGWRFAVDGTLSRVKNNWTQRGAPYYANMYDAIATGEFNFVNPELNSQATMDFVFPTISTDSKSTMAHLQGNIAKDVMELDGGPLQVGIGASIRREEIKAPSANPDRDANGNPITENADILDIDVLQRFSSGVNPFGTSGKRTVKSVYGEILAPVIDEVDLSFSGRYDSYSSGQSNFSPKAGIKVTPIREIAFRGTYSKGFRIGSFAESFGTPSTGYITGSPTLPQFYLDQIPGGAANGYVTNYALGLTQTSNPDLDPEKSRNITLGFVAEPIRNVSVSVDYWNIKKDDVITGSDYTPALAAYYAGQPIPDGFTIIPDLIAAIPAGVPVNFIPRAAFVQYQYINAATQHARGIDFAVSARTPLGGGFTYGTNLEATRLLLLDTCFGGGNCQRYDDTIGPYVITSAAGSPKWRGSWQNTLEYGRGFLSLTAFYTHGYYLTAEDIGEVRHDCDTAGGAAFNDGTVQCKVKKTLYWNLAGGLDVTDDVNVYFNINNLLDKDPPLDTMTYGGYLYNPAWANPMIIGRYFRVGAKVKM